MTLEIASIVSRHPRNCLMRFAFIGLNGSVERHETWIVKVQLTLAIKSYDPFQENDCSIPLSATSLIWYRRSTLTYNRLTRQSSDQTIPLSSTSQHLKIGKGQRSE